MYSTGTAGPARARRSAVASIAGVAFCCSIVFGALSSSTAYGQIGGPGGSNREVVGVAIHPDSAGTSQLYCIWRAQSDTSAAPKDLGTSIDWLVNGTLVATTTQPVTSDFALACTDGTGGCLAIDCGTFSGSALGDPDQEGRCLPVASPFGPACWCSATYITSGPVTPLTPGDEIMVILYPAPGAVPDDDTSDDVLTHVYSGPVPLPNRRVESLTITPDPLISGQYLVAYEIRVEQSGAIFDSQDLSTEVEIRVGGSTVDTSTHLAIADALTGGACGVPTGCAPVGCGFWQDGTGTAEVGTCRSNFDDICTCSIIRSGTATVPASAGDEIMVILRPAPGALPESHTADDVLVDSVPAAEWNRRVAGLALVPVVGTPDEYTPYASIALESFAPSTSPRDMSFELDWIVNGTVVQTDPYGASTDFAVGCDAPGSGCSTAICGTGEFGGSPIDLYCTLFDSGCGCFYGDIVPGPGILLQAGDEIMVLLRPAPGALPEPQGSDDAFVHTFEGPVPLPNRGVDALTLTPDPASGGQLVQVDFFIEAGLSSGPQILDTLVEFRVNGSPVATTTQLSIADVPVGCAATSCSGEPCGLWSDGIAIDLPGVCVPSDQGGCACRFYFVATEVVPADPGDEITVILRPSPGALPELPPFDDEETEEVPIPEPVFLRGDCNVDMSYDIGDPVTLLGELFSMDPPNSCADACDANDDGGKDIGDAIYMLSNLFDSGPAPPAPHPSCGVDPTPDPLDCVFYACPT